MSEKRAWKKTFSRCALSRHRATSNRHPLAAAIAGRARQPLELAEVGFECRSEVLGLDSEAHGAVFRGILGVDKDFCKLFSTFSASVFWYGHGKPPDFAFRPGILLRPLRACLKQLLAGAPPGEQPPPVHVGRLFSNVSSTGDLPRTHPCLRRTS